MYLIAENIYRMPDGRLDQFGVPELYNKRIYKSARGANIALGRAKAHYRSLGKPARNLVLIHDSFWPDSWYYADWAQKQTV